MQQTKTKELRRWAHEDAFVRGDEYPRITCDEILATIDAIADEIDGKTETDPSIDKILTLLRKVSNENPAPGSRDLQISREGLIARMRAYLHSAYEMYKCVNRYAFGKMLEDAYEATIDTWELHEGASFDHRVRSVLAHICCVPLQDYYRSPIPIREKKGLACWLIATDQLTMRT